MDIFTTVLYLLALCLIGYFLYKSKGLLIQIFKNIPLLLGLSQTDLKLKYAGAYLGILWAFAQPILTTFIYWFVFQIGFRSAPVENFPFILWLVTGLVPWFFFSDAIISGTGCMAEYSYLVKKVMFNINVLPMVKIISGLFVHVVFMVFVIVIYMAYGIHFTPHAIQVIYYSFCLAVLSIGITYVTATINVFIKDTIQAVSVFMQVVFWMTPIVWDINIMPEPIQFILKINPLYYIVTGYRDALINKVWFWEKGTQTLLFWLICSGVLYIGTRLFRKFKPHFADVL